MFSTAARITSRGTFNELNPVENGPDYITRKHLQRPRLHCKVVDMMSFMKCFYGDHGNHKTFMMATANLYGG